MTKKRVARSTATVSTFDARRLEMVVRTQSLSPFEAWWLEMAIKAAALPPFNGEPDRLVDEYAAAFLAAVGPLARVGRSASTRRNRRRRVPVLVP